MKSAWILVPVFSVFSAAAWAQENLSLGGGVAAAAPEELARPEPLLPSSVASTELLQEHIGLARLSLAIFGRISVPGDGTVSDNGLVYSDLFNVGLGASLEGDLMTAVGGGLEIGGYASIGYDSFSGTKGTDDFGFTVDPDDMRITTGFVGGKARGHFTPFFFWEGRLGFGVVHYNSVDAIVTDSLGSSKLQLFRSTTHGAFEIAGLAGWGSPRFAGEFGFGYRFFGAPQRGKDIWDVIDTDPFDTFIIEAGFRVRF